MSEVLTSALGTLLSQSTPYPPGPTSFFRSWFAACPRDQFLEFRGIHHETKRVVQKFFAADAVEELAAASHRHADSFDCYFGICPRIRPKGDKASVTHAPGLWAELDFKSFADGEVGALRKLAAFPLPPDWIIGTGRGFHCYWQLREPVRADAAFEGRLKAIAKALSADPAAAERARVFRIPGSFNFKYQSAPQVRVLKWPTL